jgi:fructose-specific phosphotransferase system IIC component
MPSRPKEDFSMLAFIKGIGLLLVTLSLFTLFSLKAPRGDKAMNGLANAALATFLVQAIFQYIAGDFLGVSFLGEVGISAGSLGGAAAAVLVGLAMGTDPVYAVASGVALSGLGILPGFIAAYAIHFLMRLNDRYLPDGIRAIAGALIAAAAARGLALLVAPGVDFVIGTVGEAIVAATDTSPLVMGFVLGGIMKIVCTSPLSSMALTAMLALTGLPMGIAAVACFGGAFANGIVLRRLHFGTPAQSVAVILEPLTQANIITAHPLPIYTSSFVGGGLSGIAAAALNIVDNAPGTASTIPGLLAPFAFNPPLTVLLAMGIAAACGVAGGFLVSAVFAGRAPKAVAQAPIS